ncbi:MAG: Alpha-monoglucosyldiacylglycerol synthase [Candidatus Celerinatantimonas neptuna]|nr:MAG: Alpha-monoglucosyldiacylglycerol synthase [Candidatus Celerinatantimonas neptuna]
MRVAMFTDSFYPELGGIQDSIQTIARSLSNRNYQILIVAPRASSYDFHLAKKPVQEIDLGENVHIHRLPALKIPSSTRQSRLVIPTGLCWRTLKKFRPDIIHTHTFLSAGWEALRASKKLQIPLVGTNHWAIGEFGQYAPLSADFFSQMSVKWVTRYYNHCQMVSAPSLSVIDEMLRFGLNSSHQVVSNPIDTGLFHSVSSEERELLKQRFGFTNNTILYAGRLADEKNIDVLIRALAIAVKRIPSTILALAGQGAAKARLGRLAKSLGVAEHVKFLGVLDSATLAKAYQAADLFSIASTTETQSMVLLQAMSSGLAAVGARWRALPEYIDPRSGRLAEPGNPEHFAEHFLMLLSHSQLREQLGQFARDKVQRYSINDVTTRWEKIYRQTCRNFSHSFQAYT